MTSHEALRTAREWLSTHCGINDTRDVPDLAALLTRERAAAVVAARPKIERRAKVEALEWALREYNAAQSDFDFDHPTFGAQLEAELVRLQAGKEKQDA